MNLRLAADVAEGDETFELDPIEPRELPAFRAALREQLGADEAEPVPMLHMAETIELLAKALPGARELGLELHPHRSDAEIAVDENVVLDAGDYAEAHDRLAGARALLDALRSDFSNGLEPDELSVRCVVRDELARRNREALEAFRAARMLPALFPELSPRESALLNAAMPTIREMAAIWLGASATPEDLVGLAVADPDSGEFSGSVLTRGAYRQFARKYRPLGEQSLVNYVTRRRGFPGQTSKPDALTVVLWSAEPMTVPLGEGRVETFTKPPVLTEVSLRLAN